MGEPSFADQIAALHASSFGWAMACCRRDREEAHEVLQQVYWKILSGRARYEGRSALRTWLFGVIRLTALEHRRFGVLRWLRRDEAKPVEEVPASSAPDRRAARSETAAALAAALAKLPERQREVLHLVFYEDMSINDAAAIMGVTLGTARTHYERGKTALHAMLADRRGEL
jgi:RNA polymerase sigma factor (sigma-70 family)